VSDPRVYGLRLSQIAANDSKKRYVDRAGGENDFDGWMRGPTSVRHPC
jgi:hypothetical protein